MIAAEGTSIKTHGIDARIPRFEETTDGTTVQFVVEGNHGFLMRLKCYSLRISCLLLLSIGVVAYVRLCDDEQ